MREGEGDQPHNAATDALLLQPSSICPLVKSSFECQTHHSLVLTI